MYDHDIDMPQEATKPRMFGTIEECEKLIYAIGDKTDFIRDIRPEETQAVSDMPKASSELEHRLHRLRMLLSDLLKTYNY